MPDANEKSVEKAKESALPKPPAADDLSESDTQKVVGGAKYDEADALFGKR